MVIGMDAAHDPTRKNPSVIALVATLNQKCTLHFSRCSLQPVHQEICTSLRVMFKDALDAYRKVVSSFNWAFQSMTNFNGFSITCF